MCGLIGQELSVLSSDHLHFGATSGKRIPSILGLSFEISAMRMRLGEEKRRVYLKEDKET